MFKDAISFTVAIAVMVAALFGIIYVGYASYSYFAPKYRAVDNQVFKESEQYNDGMIRDLENLQMEYMTANETQKAGLKDIIIHRFSVYPIEKLPPNLFTFYTDLRSGRI
jgi:hypothetical protein